MADLYTNLHVSPRKKRCPPDQDDDTVITPKKFRTAPITPPATASRKRSGSALPAHLHRLYTIQIGVQHALSHALATCAVSPSSDTGLVRNVLNHYSLTTYTGLTTKFGLDDLRRLCWLWEWTAESLPDLKGKSKADEDDNPFLERQPTYHPKEWTRGSMGFVLSPTSHYLKSARKRVPAYGVGIEVEMNIDKGMGGGMAAVARWTTAAETRCKEFRSKLDRWIKLHSDTGSVPNVPFADLPQLNTQKVSSLTRILASASPKAPSSILAMPPSPTRSPTKSPTKTSSREFAIPFPVVPYPLMLESNDTLTFPQTPSCHNRRDRLTLRMPSTPISTPSSQPSTPARQKGANAATAPQTPTSSRREALYERIRQRSLIASPAKAASSEVVGGKLTKDQMLKMGQEEMRRRCLLGRLGGVAESVWMLFSTPVGPSSMSATQKRRALPTSEVTTAIVKSSPVPISSAEANESLAILTSLCPFFLKQLNIAGVEWLEMPAPNATITSDGVDAGRPTPASPKGKESTEELITRSPRRVKKEAGGLRQVREIIRRELELQD